MRTLCLLAVMVAACAGPKHSGFLGDYSELKADPKYRASLSYEKPGIDLREYDRLLIDPVAIMLSEDSAAGSLGKETLQKVANAFRRIMVETIDPYYTVVTEPGPHVLRIRIAVTDVEPAPEGGQGLSVHVGSASMEAELLDSRSGERLVAVVDMIRGSHEGHKAPKEWRHVEGAFIEWSGRLLDYMDSFHRHRHG